MYAVKARLMEKSEKLKEDLDINDKMILKCIQNTWVVMSWTEFTWLNARFTG